MRQIGIFITALALAFLTAVPLVAQEETLPTGTVSGQITNLTPDGIVPTGLDVMLHAWDVDFNEKTMQNGLSDVAGTFTFESVPLNPAWIYAVMLTYDDVLYFSEPMPLPEGATNLTLEVAVYEKTNATNAVQVERQHVFFDTASGGLMVGEIYILSNLGDRTIAGSHGDDAPISPLQFSLPENAASVTFEGGEDGRFLRTPDGFVDTAPLRPGEGSGQVVVRYVLPYEDGMSYTLTPSWPTNGINFLVPQGVGLTISGDGLLDEGLRDMGDGRQVAVFSHEGLTAGDSMALTLTGALALPANVPAVTAITPAPAPGADRNVLAVGAAVLGLALIGSGYWWYRQPGKDAEGSEPDIAFDDLVRQIAQLDANYDLGHVAEPVYSQERARLRRQAQGVLAEAEAA